MNWKINSLRPGLSLSHAAALVGCCALLLHPATTFADTLYRMSWRGTAYTQGPDGRIKTHKVTEQDFVNEIAEKNGITDTRALAFVYRPEKHDTAVVWAATGEFVADVIQMEFQYTDVSNADASMIVRQAFLFDEYHDLAIGSVFGMEKSRWDANGNLKSYSFKGSWQYSTPENDTVYSGTFKTSKRITDLSE